MQGGVMVVGVLKVVGVVAISFVVVMIMHMGTSMDPQDEHNIALQCVLSAQLQTGSRKQEILQSHSTRLFSEEKSWVQLINQADGEKSEIYCDKLGGKLRALYVDGREVDIEVTPE